MMKKIILSIAIFSAATLSSFAANDHKTSSDNKACTECTKNDGECKKGKHGKDGKGRHKMKAFEGINLTDAQKTQLEALRAEFKAKKDSMKQKGEKKGNKENLTDEQKKQMKAEKMAKRQQAKRDFLDKVKGILTPEQYTQFLDNTQKMEANKEKGIKKDGKHSKGKKGHHANNGNKSQRNASKA